MHSRSSLKTSYAFVILVKVYNIRLKVDGLINRYIKQLYMADVCHVLLCIWYDFGICHSMCQSGHFPNAISIVSKIRCFGVKVFARNISPNCGTCAKACIDQTIKYWIMHFPPIMNYEWKCSRTGPCITPGIHPESYRNHVWGTVLFLLCA